MPIPQHLDFPHGSVHTEVARDGTIVQMIPSWAAPYFFPTLAAGPEPPPAPPPPPPPEASAAAQPPPCPP